MTLPDTLFEISWEVCNKVGGIHTVLSTKAKTLVERFGDDYIAIGPWLLSENEEALPFDDEPGFESFCNACRALGVPVRVGRWRIPGSPRTLLVAFSDLYPQRDEILTDLWLRFGVDSYASQWDYVEPVLFGHAAGLAVSQWWRTYRGNPERRAVVQCHEWLTGSALLHCVEVEPSIGTVFTTHATVLGRSASSNGRSLDEAPPEVMAVQMHVRNKHSLEGVTAAQADVFTTVSAITAQEAATVLGRDAHPLLPNGIDLEVSDQLTGGVTREEAEATVRRVASRFLGRAIDDAALVCISGRYEFRNKGIDVLLEAAGELNNRPGKPFVLLVLVPAGNSGIRQDLLERLEAPEPSTDGPIGISTHNLFDPDNDPVHASCLRLGLDNAVTARVTVVQVPIYLQPGDGLFDMPYEAVLQAMDLSCFPSAYEPWGYTPQESLVAGVPTITSDCAGFGRWCIDQGVRSDDGVTVLARTGRSDAAAAADLADVIQAFLEAPRDDAATIAACRATAERVSWDDLIARYYEAFDLAVAAAAERSRTLPPSFAPTVSVPARDEGDRAGPRLFTFDVEATLPDSLAALSRLAYNYWWCTDAGAVELFASLDPVAWSECGHNPVSLLRHLPPTTLQARASDPEYLAALDAVVTRFEAYLAAPLQSAPGGPGPERPIAYLSAEFGVHESLPIYSGGLGVLAGDHLKSASDLGLPLIGLGLFYHKGYFSQSVTTSGEQLARDVPLDPRELPLEPVLDAGGDPVEITIGLPGSVLTLRAWRAIVGRVPLLLLDADLPVNRPEDRAITRNLYSADAETRLRQEIVLGKGSVRLLRALGVEPSGYHLNEGHAAFAGLERVDHLVHGEGLTFDEALMLVRATTLFTTHTPVAAGHDRFDADLMRRYFSDAPEWIGVPYERFFALGEQPGEEGVFNMTGLAIRVSEGCNAVSEVHQRVSQRLLAPYWQEQLVSDVPVGVVTNGVHLPSWTHPDMARLLGAVDRPVTGDDFSRSAGAVEDADLWAFRTASRRRLIAAARLDIEDKFYTRHDSPRLLADIQDGLSDDVLVLGFARRFAPYKRADLLLRDIDRLAALLGDEKHPVRLFVSGKAHPNDRLGQEILQRLVVLSRDARFAGRVIFVEDQDIALSRLLVQGCDVWLNTPRHSLEASGTSGMKAAANGSLNVSIADGWWPEAYDGANGWSIGGPPVYSDQSLQDELDATILYELLEEEIVRLFYKRGTDGLPHGWLARVKHSLQSIPVRFNSDRMVDEYLADQYRPCAASGAALGADRFAALHVASREEDRLGRAFAQVRILDSRVSDLAGLNAGDTIAAQLVVDLGELHASDVRAELVIGRPDGPNRLEGEVVVPLAAAGSREDGATVFEGQHAVKRAGTLAYGLRVAAGLPAPRGVTEYVLWA